MATITLEVDARSAMAYQNAPSTIKLGLAGLVDAFLIEPTEQERQDAKRQLFVLMDKIGKNAINNGVTPEELEEILGQPIKHLF